MCGRPLAATPEKRTEVSVSDGRQQLFEYINCHPATGMMRDAEVPADA